MSQEKETMQTTADVQDAIAENPVQEGIFLEMAKAGVLYGHKKSRRDPHFEPYVFAIRNGVEVIDLEQTLVHIEKMAATLSELSKAGKKIMVVGTQPAAHEAVRNLAAVLKGLYVVNKWVGGLITNYAIISERIAYFNKQKAAEEKNEFAEYTKKERLMMHREIEKMAEKFEGIENINGTPDALFIIDSSPKGHKAAMREGRRKNAKVFGIIDNDDNPDDFDQFIPANDHAKASIDWVIDALIERIK